MSERGPLLHDVTAYDEFGVIVDHRKHLKSRAAARLAMEWQGAGLRAWIRPPLSRDMVLEAASWRRR